jgi:GAF domain-containing protein
LKRFKQVLLTGQEMNQRLSTVEELFEVISRGVADVLDLSHFFMLSMYRPHTDRLNIHYSHQGERGVIWDRPLAGATAWVIESGMPLVVSSFSDQQRSISLLPEEKAGADPESLIFVPLTFRSTVLGVLSVQHPSRHAFDDTDLQVVSLLANQIALAVNNLRLFDHLTTLNRIGRALTGQLDSNELPKLVAHSIREATGADVVTLFPYDASAGRFEQATISGVLIAPNSVSLDEGRSNDVARLAIERSGPIWANDSTRLYELLAGEGQTRLEDFEQREHITSIAVLPLRVGDSTTGVLFVSYRQRQHFDATQRTLILSLADYASIALRNSHTLLALSRRRLEELQALRAIEQRMMTQLDDPGQVMRVVLAESMKLLDADSCELHLYDEGRPGTTYSARKDDGTMLQPRRYDGRESPPSRHGIVTHVAETFITYVTGDAAKDKLYTGGPEVRSVAAFPLLSDERLIGVLNLESYKTYAFDVDDVRLLQVFAGQAVIALRKAEAYARVKLESRRFKLLYEAGRELSKITDSSQLEEAYDIVAAGVGEFSDGEVVIRRYDPATESLVRVRVENELYAAPPREAIPKGVGVHGHVARELRTIWIDDIDNLPEGLNLPIRHDPSVKALVVVPLVFENFYYGNLALSHGRANSFDDDDINLLRGLAGQLAITVNRIETAQARVEAERRAGEAMLMSQVGQTTMALTHRLGNYLGLVKMYAKNIVRAAEAQGIDGGPIKENLEKIVRDVSNVLEMSLGVKRAFASLGGPSALAERSPVSAGELLDLARQSLPPLHDGIAVEWECDDPAAMVQVRAGHVADILSNLVVNAAEAMPEGGAVSVRSYILRSNEFGPRLYVEISDTGPGVPETQQGKLFNLFYSTKRSSGFGLWSARQYAKANGGDLSYEQRDGVGATFVLRLPLAPVPEETE